jgi:hypothetical protein
VQDVARALRIQPLQLTDASHRQHRKEAARWFGAKWAQRIAETVVRKATRFYAGRLFRSDPPSC